MVHLNEMKICFFKVSTYTLTPQFICPSTCIVWKSQNRLCVVASSVTMYKTWAIYWLPIMLSVSESYQHTRWNAIYMEAPWSSGLAVEGWWVGISNWMCVSETKNLSSTSVDSFLLLLAVDWHPIQVEDPYIPTKLASRAWLKKKQALYLYIPSWNYVQVNFTLHSFLVNKYQLCTGVDSSLLHWNYWSS